MGSAEGGRGHGKYLRVCGCGQALAGSQNELVSL